MTKLSSSKAYFATLAVVMAGAILFYPQFWMSHDNSWYLVATRMFLEGKQLYTEIVEINPPLAFYETVPALVLADLTGLNDTTAYQLWVIAISALSCVLQWQVLARSDLGPQARAVFLYSGVVGLFILPIHEFGQREHWLLIFALPYFYHLILRQHFPREQKAWAIIIGIIASFGLCLKPYFLMIPAALVIPGSFREFFSRVMDPSNLAVAFGALVYLAFILQVHPEYVNEVVPTAVQVYSSFGDPAHIVLMQGEVLGVLALILLISWGGLPSDMISWRIIFALIGAILCYLIQFKGWNYQLIPASFFMVLTSVWLVYKKRAIISRDIAQPTLALMVLMSSLGTQIVAGPVPHGSKSSFVARIKEPNERILVLSTNVSAAFPFVNMVGGVWTSRYPAQWEVPGAVVKLARTDCDEERSVCDSLAQILANSRSAMVEDFLMNQPEAVFIDDRENKSYFEGQPFDYIEFMRSEPGFSEAWDHYRFVERIGDYTYWRRYGDDTGPGGPASSITPTL